MFIVIGCLGTVIGEADSIDAAIVTVQSQFPLTDKKQRSMRNALGTLKAGAEYHIEYGGSGCTVRRS